MKQRVSKNNVHTSYVPDVRRADEALLYSIHRQMMPSRGRDNASNVACNCGSLLDWGWRSWPHQTSISPLAMQSRGHHFLVGMKGVQPPYKMVVGAALIIIEQSRLLYREMRHQGYIMVDNISRTYTSYKIVMRTGAKSCLVKNEVSGNSPKYVLGTSSKSLSCRRVHYILCCATIIMRCSNK